MSSRPPLHLPAAPSQEPTPATAADRGGRPPPLDIMVSPQHHVATPATAAEYEQIVLLLQATRRDIDEMEERLEAHGTRVGSPFVRSVFAHL